MWFDTILGSVIFATTGALIGYYLDHLGIAFSGVALGVMLGSFVARLGARYFFLSVLFWTVVCAALGWWAGGPAVVPMTAGTGGALGGFLGITLQFLISGRRERAGSEASDEAVLGGRASRR